jgi:hypothetical protein
MHGVNHDTGSGQSIGPHLGEDHLPALGSGICGSPAVLLSLKLKVVGPGPFRVHATGADVDDSGRSRPSQTRDQEICEQEVAGEIRGEGHLDPLVGHEPMGEQHSDVVDEQVEARLRLEQPDRQAADVRHQAQVRLHRDDVAGQLVLDRLQLFRVSSNDDDPCSHRGQR